MSFLFDGIKAMAGAVGTATGKAAYKAQLKTELMLIEREITSRQSAFGIELYDYVAPLSRNPHFYSSDDTLTVTLQPPLIMAQREVLALEIKRDKLKWKINEAAAKRAAAFTPANDIAGKLANAGKSTALAGNEAKLNTEMSLLNAEIKRHKQQFGINLYKRLEELEDTSQWLPTDREIRCIYDNCRRDIEKIKKRKAEKEKELLVVDGLAEREDEQSRRPGRRVEAEHPMYASQSQAQPALYATQGTISMAAPAAAPPTSMNPATNVPAVYASSIPASGATSGHYSTTTSYQAPYPTFAMDAVSTGFSSQTPSAPTQTEPMNPMFQFPGNSNSTSTQCGVSSRGISQKQPKSSPDPFMSDLFGAPMGDYAQSQPVVTVTDPFAISSTAPAPQPLSVQLQNTNFFSPDPFATLGQPALSQAKNDLFTTTGTTTTQTNMNGFGNSFGSAAASAGYNDDPFAGL